MHFALCSKFLFYAIFIFLTPKQVNQSNRLTNSEQTAWSLTQNLNVVILTNVAIWIFFFNNKTLEICCRNSPVLRSLEIVLFLKIKLPRSSRRQCGIKSTMSVNREEDGSHTDGAERP